MPSRNSIKNFDSDSMYHVYNRGNNKRLIFIDSRDYAVFLSFLKYALLSDDHNQAVSEVDASHISSAQRYNLRRLGLSNRLELAAYCLMPNHFHLLVYQNDPEAITALMRSVCTGYTMYFNKRHGCTGKLYEGVYKAVHIDSDAYWEHISRYIHLNPVDLGVDYRSYEFSSYKNYVNLRVAAWLKPEKGMASTSAKQYEEFVSGWLPHRQELKDIGRYLAN